MKHNLRRLLTLLALVLVLCAAMCVSAAASDPPEEPGTKMIECKECGASGAWMEL